MDEYQKLEKATNVQRNASEFLKRSAQKHVVTRAVIKYGPRRIAAVVSAILLLTLSSFGIRNYMQRQNSNVLSNLKGKTLELASNSDVTLRNRAMLICEELMLGEVTIPEVIQNIGDPVEKINVSISIASLLVYQGTNEPKKEIFQSLAIADSLLDAFPVSGNVDNASKIIKAITELREALELGYFYNPSDSMDAFRVAVRKHWHRGAALQIMTVTPPCTSKTPAEPPSRGRM